MLISNVINFCAIVLNFLTYIDTHTQTHTHNKPTQNTKLNFSENIDLQELQDLKLDIAT